MLIGFFLHLKAARLPVSTREFLTLLEALEARVVSLSLDDFYHLARAALVKDEAQYDRYDLAFATYFQRRRAVRHPRGDSRGMAAQGIRAVALGRGQGEGRGAGRLGQADGDASSKRLEEQKGRHAGGNKWIGTGGTSPFGAYGYNPEGIRAGQLGSGNRSAVKVWDERSFRNLDGDVLLNTRNIKIALRRLRRFAREGVPEELDMDGTIAGTARNAGYLDLHLVPERRNRVKVLLFLDVGGSMDPHISVCEELFSATRTEFRHLEHFYFHNCVYDYVWRDNARRRFDRVATWDILHKYGPDWKVIFVGDAAMSPYELVQAGGSVEYANEEPGALWLKRIADHFRRVIWWNPEPPRAWEYTRSTQIVLQSIGPRMYPLTLDGIASGIDALRH